MGEAQGLAQEHRQDQLVQPRGVVVGRRAPALSYPLPISLGPRETMLAVLIIFHDYIDGVDKSNSDIDSFENIPFVLKCGN